MRHTSDSVPWTALEGLVLGCSLLIITIGLSTVWLRLGFIASNPNHVVMEYLVKLVLTSIIFWLIAIRGKHITKDNFCWKWMHPLVTTFVIIATYVGFILLQISLATLEQIASIDIPGFNLDEAQSIFPISNHLGLVLIAVIIAPIVEEVVFRGVILQAIAKSHGTIAGVIVSSMLFSAIHVQASHFTALMIVGVILGMLFLRTKSLQTVIFYHMFSNASALLIQHSLFS